MSTIGALLAREIEQMEQRALVEAVGLEILEHQRAGRQRRRQVAVLEQFRAPARARPPPPPRSRRDGVLPEPSGPTSAMTRSGQSGQRSISAKAAAFDGPARKSSRAKLVA